jgi:predicted nucleotidyltransferase
MRKHLLDALFPKIRQKLLELFLLHPDKWWYLSELAKQLDVSPSSLQRELTSFYSVQILEIRKEANRIYYRSNLATPGILDLQNLFIKTGGIIFILNSLISKFDSEIELAFIYGSYAQGALTNHSDVDLMLVGNVRLFHLAPLIEKAERKIGREIQVTIYSKIELQKRWKEGDPFIKEVFQGKRIILKGSEHEYQIKSLD